MIEIRTKLLVGILLSALTASFSGAGCGGSSNQDGTGGTSGSAGGQESHPTGRVEHEVPRWRPADCWWPPLRVLSSANIGGEHV
jgi:hypothetical protein